MVRQLMEFILYFLQEIRKGLLKAAKTTGAWIFTGGTNTGKCFRYKSIMRVNHINPKNSSSNLFKAFNLFYKPDFWF